MRNYRPCVSSGCFLRSVVQLEPHPAPFASFRLRMTCREADCIVKPQRSSRGREIEREQCVCQRGPFIFGFSLIELNFGEAANKIIDLRKGT